MNRLQFGIQKGSSVYVSMSAYRVSDDSPVNLASQTLKVRLVDENIWTDDEVQLLEGVITTFTGDSSNIAEFEINHTTTTNYSDVEHGYFELELVTFEGRVHKSDPNKNPDFRIGQKVATNFDGKIYMQGTEDNIYFQLEDDLKLPFPTGQTQLNGRSFSGMNGLSFTSLNDEPYQAN
ncbi:MAG: hypothetical protein ACFB15_23690 [Cyclobacteriaceae bacterium]